MKDYDREYEPKRKETKKKGGGFLGKFIALLLGFVLGVTGVVGGVAGVGWYALTQPVNEVENKVNGVAGTDIDLQKYLTDTYYKGTVKDLLGGVVGAAQAFAEGTGSFGTLNAISPAVGDALNKLTDKIVSLGAEMPREEIYEGLLSTKLADFGAFLVSVLDSVRVGEMLLGTGAFNYETMKNDSLMLLFFYGVEGEDYTLDEENQKIVASDPLTVGDLRANGLTMNLQTIPLDTLIAADSDMMCAILYGSSARYEKDGEGVITMKPAVYTLEDRGDGEKIYDDKDNAYELTNTDGVLTITVNEKTQYLEGIEGNAYRAFKDAEKTQPVLYSKTTIGDLQNNPTSVLKSVRLADVMEVTADDKIMATIAYGEEGVDWKRASADDPTIIPINPPKTIADLTNVNDLLDTITLESLMTIDKNDGMMRALAYGDSWKYTTEKNAEGVVTAVHMKQMRYTFDETENAFFDEAGEKVLARAEVKDASAGILAFALLDDKGNETDSFYLKATDATGKNFIAFQDQACTEAKKYSKTTIKHLQDDPDGILHGIELGSAMKIDGSSNPILIQLAYGEEGVDYELNGTEIVPLPGGKKPTTIGDLQEDGKMDETISNMPLASIMTNIDYTDSMILALLYGAQWRYTPVKDGGATVGVEMNQVVYTRQDGKFYDAGGNEIVGTLGALDGDKYPFTLDEETFYLKTNDNTTFTAWKYEDPSKPYLYKETTIGKLQNDPSSILNDIELGTALGVTKDSNKVLIAIAYGKQDIDYRIDTETGKIVPINPPTTIKALSENSDSIINGIYIADAVNVNADSHPVLIALAYGSGYTKNADKTVTPADGQTPRTISQLSGENSKTLIDEITLEDALGVTATSDKMLRSLAFGREGVQYHYDETTQTFVMHEVFYTYDETTQTYADCNGNPLQLQSPVAPSNSSDFTLTLQDGSTLTLTKDPARENTYFEKKSDGSLNKYQKSTIGSLSADTSAILDNVTLEDALSLNDQSHPVLLALAYGNGYIKNADGTVSPADGEQLRTISALSGDNSTELINEITLEDALGITHESDRIIRALAFGTENVQYYIDKDNGNAIVMNQVYYTWNEDVDGKAYIHDHTDAILDLASPANLTASDIENLGETKILTLTVKLSDTETETLRLVKDAVYHDRLLKVDENGNPVYYEKATIGDLSGSSQDLLNEITLQDALGIKSFEEETDAFKKAIAFSKDGKPYTIGQLSNDPSTIVNEIHLDSVMTPNPASAMTMYLLYGKKNIHFTVKKQAEMTEAEKAHATQIEEKDEYVVMLQKQMAVHYADGKYHLHNEYGEPVYANNSTDFVELTPITTVGGVVTVFEYSIVDEEGIAHLYRLQKANGLPDIRIKNAKDNSLVQGFDTYAPAYYVQAEKKDDYGNAHSGVFEAAYYEHNKMGDLTSGETEIVTHLTERLTLEEVLEADEVNNNTFLSHLSHTVIDELPEAIDSLTVTQVFEDQVFETKKDASGNAILVNGQPIYIIREEQADGSVTVLEVYKNPKNEKYYTSYALNGSEYSYAGEVDGNKRALTGTWKYLLTDPATGETKDCAVTDINSLVDNMTQNIQDATLGELVEDGIITFQDDADQTAEVKKTKFLNSQFTNPYNTTQTYRLKDMSIIAMIELIMSMSSQAP
ncbi:MAG: hypothetical protein IJB34_02275 [Clostridia bacterium]|nr:hypothetical protein [Clostridia bacterium]